MQPYRSEYIIYTCFIIARRREARHTRSPPRQQRELVPHGAILPVGPHPLHVQRRPSGVQPQVACRCAPLCHTPVPRHVRTGLSACAIVSIPIRVRPELFLSKPGAR